MGGGVSGEKEEEKKKKKKNKWRVSCPGRPFWLFHWFQFDGGWTGRRRWRRWRRWWWFQPPGFVPALFTLRYGWQNHRNRIRKTHVHTHTHTLVYRWIDGWMDGWMDRRRKRGKVGYRLNTSHPNLKHPATAEPPTEPPTEPPAEPPNQPTQTTSPATLQSPRRRCLFIYFFSCCFSYPSLPFPSLPCPPPISLLLPWINHVWLGFSSGFLSILPCLFV